MGFFDRLKDAFHKDSRPRAGEPMTLAQAKELLAGEVSSQPLADMRKTAERVKRLNDELPQFVTFTMSYFCDNTRLARFTNNGGKQIDASAAADIFANTAILQDARAVQAAIGDFHEIKDRLDPSRIGGVDPSRLVDGTRAALERGGEAARSWMFALLDSAEEIGQATGGNVAPVLEALGRPGADDLRAALVAMLYPDPAKPAPDYVRDPTARTTDYGRALEVLQA